MRVRPGVYWPFLAWNTPRRRAAAVLCKAMEPNPNLIALAREAAKRHNLSPALVCAVIEQESSWDPWVTRYEWQFFDRYMVRLLGAAAPTDTQARGLATSWGLMQVMGQTAREHGYHEPLAKLCDAATGLEWGCRILNRKLAMHPMNPEKGLLAWNGGGRKEYAAEVLGRRALWEERLGEKEETGPGKGSRDAAS